MWSLGRALIPGCPHKKRETETDTYEGKMMWRQRENTICKPRNTWHYQDLGGRYAPPSQSSEGTSSADPLISDFQPPEVWEDGFCYSSHPVCGSSLRQPLETNSVFNTVSMVFRFSLTTEKDVISGEGEESGEGNIILVEWYDLTDEECNVPFIKLWLYKTFMVGRWGTKCYLK